jgi:hypothetical protein
MKLVVVTLALGVGMILLAFGNDLGLLGLAPATLFMLIGDIKDGVKSV